MKSRLGYSGLVCHPGDDGRIFEHQRNDPLVQPGNGRLVAGDNGLVAMAILAVVYFYSHYLFASSTAHVSAMYAAFLSVMASAGAPPTMAAYVLAWFSSLFGCLTHYGSGPAPIFLAPDM